MVSVRPEQVVKIALSSFSIKHLMDVYLRRKTHKVVANALNKPTERAKAKLE